MTFKNAYLVTLTASSILASHLAQAGPPVHITVKNLGDQEMHYQSTSAMTQAHASPTPALSIKGQSSNSFSVVNAALPDVTTASLRYTMGNKACDFRTSYINSIVPGGLFSGKLNTAPKWDKKATGSGNATCTVTVTSTNFSDHSWSVVFTMR